jgi:undecaprenyl diphosphate synthase
MLIKKTKGLPVGIDPDRLPKHIAIIMDGNGRWAKKRKLPRIEGHRAGSRAVRETVETCVKTGIQALTLFAFSTENWNRPKDEVDALMDLLSQYLDRESKTVLDNNLRFKMIGRREGLRKDILLKVDKMESDSAGDSGMLFCLALNYSGRAELVDCFKKIAKGLKKDTKTEINESIIASNLYTSDIPDPDLLIRTSGEMRISNFLLWQIAYSEIWITDVLWPDFKAKHLFQAIRDYQKRERRFGGIKE